MAEFKTHCNDCIEQLGEPFEKVHKWLDEFAERMGPAHRSIRHNDAGIAEVRRMWGEQAEKAARIHIERDIGANHVEIGGIWRPGKALSQRIRGY